LPLGYSDIALEKKIKQKKTQKNLANKSASRWLDIPVTASQMQSWTGDSSFQ
jgi:hypothetical protein